MNVTFESPKQTRVVHSDKTTSKVLCSIKVNQVTVGLIFDMNNAGQSFVAWYALAPNPKTSDMTYLADALSLELCKAKARSVLKRKLRRFTNLLNAVNDSGVESVTKPMISFIKPSPVESFNKWGKTIEIQYRIVVNGVVVGIVWFDPDASELGSVIAWWGYRKMTTVNDCKTGAYAKTVSAIKSKVRREFLAMHYLPTLG